jgi:hypothetical protein
VLNQLRGNPRQLLIVDRKLLAASAQRKEATPVEWITLEASVVLGLVANEVWDIYRGWQAARRYSRH